MNDFNNTFPLSHFQHLNTTDHILKHKFLNVGVTVFKYLKKWLPKGLLWTFFSGCVKFITTQML